MLTSDSSGTDDNVSLWNFYQPAWIRVADWRRSGAEHFDA
jgi:hypothetical protein